MLLTHVTHERLTFKKRSKSFVAMKGRQPNIVIQAPFQGELRKTACLPLE
jgi:hypothetical protein